VQQHVQALHLVDEGIDAKLLTCDPSRRAEASALGRAVDGPHDLLREGVGVALGHDRGVTIVREDVQQTIGVSGNNWFSHRQRLERGNGSTSSRATETR
jgi:hypothetical protein